jgi:hypothetical protein
MPALADGRSGSGDDSRKMAGAGRPAPERGDAFQILSHLFFGQIGEPKSRSCRRENEASRSERELTIEPHIHFSAGFFELPGIKAAMRRQAQIDTIVSREVVRRLRRFSLCEVVLLRHRHSPALILTEIAPQFCTKLLTLLAFNEQN